MNDLDVVSNNNGENILMNLSFAYSESNNFKYVNFIMCIICIYYVHKFFDKKLYNHFI